MTDYSNTTVKIAVDDEGMLGGMSSEEIATVDVDATYQKYLEQLSAKIRKAYPGINIETSIGPTTYSTKIVTDLDSHEESMMYDTIQDWGAEVYNDQDFWVLRNF